MLDAFAVPTIIVDEAGKFVGTNAAGAALLDAADVVFLKDGHVRFTARGFGSQTVPRLIPPEKPSVMMRDATDPAGLPRVVAWQLSSGDGIGAVALVFLSTGEHSGPEAVLLASLYRLSPAEVRVAREIFAGHSARETAARLCVNVETVRSHLKNIHTKTGTKGRGELVRLLAHVAMLRGEVAASLQRLQTSPRGRVGGVTRENGERHD